MLSDGTLRGIKPQATTYKIADRDGMYVTVSPRGTITFRLDYRLNGRRETLTIGRYGSKDGISLLMARERCTEARKAIAEGRSPSQEKQREKRRMSEAKTFEEFTKRWLEEARMAESTKSMRKSIIDRDILPVFRNRLMAEIGPEDLRNLCAKVKARGAPATAVHVRDIVKQVFGFAACTARRRRTRGRSRPLVDRHLRAKDRALSPSEIRVMHRVLDATATLPTIRLALRLILLTLVRKSELIEATWDEVDFENAVWTIPKSRMKAGKPHNVYLSQQALDIMVALRTCASGSKFLLPSRYDADRCMSKATLNRVTQIVAERAKEAKLPLEPFTVHDLRRTGSTILNELGFNSDWIEKCLAHEDGRSSRGVYNKAEYAEQRRHMLQEWADMIDAWVAGKSTAP
jgi:integrase